MPSFHLFYIQTFKHAQVVMSPTKKAFACVNNINMLG